MIPASGRDFDSRLPMISVVACTVSFSNRGWGNFTSAHAEIGDCGADRQVRNRHADHEAEREQRVHQRLAPLGLLLAEMSVDMQGLRVERHVREQHVVHLRHRAPVTMFDDLADFEVLEIHSAPLVTHRRCERHLSRSPMSNSPSLPQLARSSFGFVYHIHRSRRTGAKRPFRFYRHAAFRCDPDCAALASRDLSH